MKSLPIVILMAVFIAGISACESQDAQQAVGILAWERLELSNESNETIASIQVKEGQSLEPGAEILRFDERRIMADIKNAQAVIQQAEARLKELRNGPRAEEINRARALLKQALSEQKLAQTELKRIKLLARQKLMSPDDLDKAKARLQSASAQVAANQAALNLLQQGSRPEVIEQAQQALVASRAKLRRLQVGAEDLLIRTPLAGVVDELPYKVGENPPPGSVVAVMLVGKQPYARVYVPEPLRASLHIGSEARIKVDGIPTLFHGRIRSLSRDPVFTPYYSLSKGDRSRLAYKAKIDLIDAEAADLAAGIPLTVSFTETSGASR